MRKKRFVGDKILDVFSTNISYFKLISTIISYCLYAYVILVSFSVKERKQKFSSPALNIFRCFWTQCQVPDVVVVVWGGCMMVYDLLQ